MTSYEAAGVDIAAGERAVALMKSRVARSRRPEVVDDASGFAGLFDASAFLRYKRPLLATSTDGVGTKVDLARRLGIYDTVGHDLVGMVIDDLAVCGAEPLFMTDYIACGKVVPERIADIVGGIADACALAGCALVGGETAEHPGLLEPDEFDIAGPVRASWKPTTSSAPTVCARATPSSPWPRPECIRTGTRSSGTSSRPRTSPWSPTRTNSAVPWARNSSPPPASTRRTASPSPRPGASTRSRTSPEAAWP